MLPRTRERGFEDRKKAFVVDSSKSHEEVHDLFVVQSGAERPQRSKLEEGLLMGVSSC
jgi:hypothetical protein